MTEERNRRYEGFVQDGRFYVDRYTLARMFNRPVATVRAHCPPAIEQPNATGGTKRTYYDAAECGKILADVPRRSRVVDHPPRVIADLEPTAAACPEASEAA